MRQSALSTQQAVFRAYDTDNSGSISLEEFEAISSNFPFVECFSVLDQDEYVVASVVCCNLPLFSLK